MSDFFNSKSMVTPGVAGLTTTMITGTLVGVFGFDGAITGLVVSFVLGLLVWYDTKVVLQERLLLYVINSMVIFTVATGINQAGIAATGGLDRSGYQTRSVSGETEKPPFFHSWF